MAHAALRVVYVENDRINHFLRGGVVGGKDLSDGVYGLDGLTLVFTSPAATVTFSTPGSSSQEKLTLPEIISQIATVLGGGFLVSQLRGRLAIVEAAPSAGVALGTTGTGHQLLGFPNDTAVVGTVYGPPNEASPPLLVSIQPSTNSNTSLITVAE